MAINIFKHPIIDGIVDPEDQPVLDNYVVTHGTSATNVRDTEGFKQGDLHIVTLSDGTKVRARLRKQRELENHSEKNLIKQTSGRGNVRYYMLETSSTEYLVKLIVDGYIQHVMSDIDQHVTNERYKFDALEHFQNNFDIQSENLAENIKNALSRIGNLAVGVGYYPAASIYEVALNEPDQARRALSILFSTEYSEQERVEKFRETMIPLSEQYSNKTVSHPFNMDLRFISLLLSLYSPDRFMYFKPTEVEKIHTELYDTKTGSQSGDINRILKARNLGVAILKELQSRSEFHAISEAMGYADQYNLWFAQDVIWWAAHRRKENTDELAQLESKIRKFLEDNPSFLDEVDLTKEQINTAVADFQSRFSIEKLEAMSDDDIVRSIIYNQDSTKDGLSYLLQHSPVIGRMGGIRGGSAGTMGYYQGSKDGLWKKHQSNAVTTKEDVLRHRRYDIEVLSKANDFISRKDFDGLAAYQKSLKDNAADATEQGISIADSDDRYKSIVLGLIWVRKYFAVLHPDEFIQVYGNDFIEKLEKLANIGDINGNDSGWDYSLWYRKMNQIAGLSSKLGMSTYELSRILWAMINEEDGSSDKEEDAVDEVNTTKLGLNTIIYGPPGTGKTFSIREYKDRLLSNQQSKFENQIKGSVKDTLLFIFKQNNNTPLNSFDIWRSEQFQKLQEYNGRTKSNGSAIRNELEYDNVLFERIEDNGVKYRATDEGLEYIRSILEAQSEESTSSIDDFYEFITFHQSYGYEEFIEGIRAETNDAGTIRYAVRDGVFKAFCRRAESDPNNNYLFVIDEINRANISKVFGELITLIEPSKRLGASEELTTTLPYSGEKFGIPKNVHVVGTMNTADRSIALLDIALRRRFDFEELMPNPELVSLDVKGINLQKLLTTINAKVSEEIDRNHQVGHSYFMDVSSLSDLHRVWYQRVVPLLQEYFYDDTDDLRNILKSFIDKNEVVVLSGDEFKQAIANIYEETQSTDSGIRL